MRNWISTPNALVLAAAVVASTSAGAQESACLFAANQASTVHIEYRYRTVDGEVAEQGTGFVVSDVGHVLTNAHVVSPRQTDAKVEWARLSLRVGGLMNPVIEADVLARDPSVDLALVKLPARLNDQKWPTVTVGNAANLPVGSRLIGMGFPLAGDLSIVPAGEKTAHNTVVDGQLKPWWQTNLALNPGNSGGPIFGSLGTVVGIAVAKRDDAQQISYVIPIARAQHLLDAADVKSAQAGRCAVFPECRHASHGIERHLVDAPVSQWGPWRKGGYNQGAYCNDFLATLQQQHPNSTFTFTRSDEQSRSDTLRNVDYRYYCEYRRLEQPEFSLRRSPACL